MLAPTKFFLLFFFPSKLLFILFLGKHALEDRLLGGEKQLTFTCLLRLFNIKVIKIDVLRLEELRSLN